MELRQLSNLLLRFAGLFIIVHTVLAVPDRVIRLFQYTGNTTYSHTEIWLLSILSGGLSAIVGLALLYFPSKITYVIIGKHSVEPNYSIAEFQSVAFSTLGLYFISAGLYDAIYWVAKVRLYYFVVEQNSSYYLAPAMLPTEFAGIVATILQIIIGIGLLFGSKGLSALIAKLRGY